MFGLFTPDGPLESGCPDASASISIALVGIRQRHAEWRGPQRWLARQKLVRPKGPAPKSPCRSSLTPHRKGRSHAGVRQRRLESQPGSVRVDPAKTPGPPSRHRADGSGCLPTRRGQDAAGADRQAGRASELATVPLVGDADFQAWRRRLSRFRVAAARRVSRHAALSSSPTSGVSSYCAIIASSCRARYQSFSALSMTLLRSRSGWLWTYESTALSSEGSIVTLILARCRDCLGVATRQIIRLFVLPGEDSLTRSAGVASAANSWAVGQGRRGLA